MQLNLTPFQLFFVTNYNTEKPLSTVNFSFSSTYDGMSAGGSWKADWPADSGVGLDLGEGAGLLGTGGADLQT